MKKVTLLSSRRVDGRRPHAPPPPPSRALSLSLGARGCFPLSFSRSLALSLALEGALLSTGTLASGHASQDQYVCLADASCFELVVTAGDAPSDISFAFIEATVRDVM